MVRIHRRIETRIALSLRLEQQELQPLGLTGAIVAKQDLFGRRAAGGDVLRGKSLAAGVAPVKAALSYLDQINDTADRSRCLVASEVEVRLRK